MPITRRFTVYTNAGVSVPPVIHVNQYDRGETWIFTLLEPNGSQYIPASGGIVGIKADGHAIINTATVNSNGEVVVSETQQMTAAPGKAVYEIIFDNSTHGTANFIVCVEPKPGDNATLSDSDLSLIQEAIDSTIPANIEASVQDWMDDNLAPAEWVIDNTLSIAGAAADAKKVGDVTSELKTKTNLNTEIINQSVYVEDIPLTMTKNRQIAIALKEIVEYGGNTFSVSNSIDVQEGETYRISAKGNYTTAAYAFADADGIVITVPDTATSGAYYVYEDHDIIIPEGITKLYVANCTAGDTTITPMVKKYKTDPSVKYVSQTLSDSEKNKARKNIDAVSEESFLDVAAEKYTQFSVTPITSKLLADNGSITDYSGHNQYMITDYINVAGKEKVKVNASAKFANGACAFYASDYSVISVPLISATGSTITYFNNQILQVPDNAVYMVVARITDVPEAWYMDGYEPAKAFADLKWCAVGDSLTERNTRTTKNYADYISDETGISVVNMGESGSGYKRKEDTSKAFYQRVLNIPTDSDVVTIFGSGNDMHYSADFGTPTDTGTATVAGCINTTIDNIYSILPAVQLGIIAPCPWENYNPANANNAMAQYTELLRQICYNRSIPFLDLYHESNLRPWDSAFLPIAYSHDDGNGTHPDETGHKIIAGRIRGFLDSLIGSY